MLKWEGFCSSVFIWQIPRWHLDVPGLQLVVRKEELEQSTGEHSPGVSLPGNSGLLSTFQDIRCFYHWNCSLDDLKKWCGNCQNDSSSLWVLYLCCDRNKDPNYIIAVVNVLEDSKSCLSGASNWEHSKCSTFWKISLSRCLRCIVHFFDGFWKVQFLRCPCVIHFDSDWIGPGVFARRLRGTKGRSGNFVLWSKNMLARDWAGWMSIRREFNIVRIQDTMTIMTTMNMFEVFACFKISIQDVWVSWTFGEVFEEKDKQQRALALECVVVCNQKHLWASKQLYLHIQLAMGK